MFCNAQDPLIDDLVRYSQGRWDIFRTAIARSPKNQSGDIHLTDLVKNIDVTLEEQDLLNGRKKYKRESAI